MGPPISSEMLGSVYASRPATVFDWNSSSPISLAYKLEIAVGRGEQHGCFKARKLTAEFGPGKRFLCTLFGRELDLVQFGHVVVACPVSINEQLETATEGSFIHGVRDRRVPIPKTKKVVICNKTEEAHRG